MGSQAREGEKWLQMMHSHGGESPCFSKASEQTAPSAPHFLPLCSPPTLPESSRQLKPALTYLGKQEFQIQGKQ